MNSFQLTVLCLASLALCVMQPESTSSLLDSSNQTQVDSSTTDPQPLFQVPNGITYDQICQIHGILMFMAWGVAPFIGIYIAKFCKSLGHAWYLLHMSIFIALTGGFAVAAFLLIVMYYTPPHFSDAHQAIGFTMILALFGQILLGFIINFLWSKDRATRPWWDHLHHWVGRGLCLLGVINIGLGLTEYSVNVAEISDGWYFAYTIWLVIVVGIFVVKIREDRIRMQIKDTHEAKRLVVVDE